MGMRKFAFCLACLTLTAGAGPDWPRFRGPNGSGIQADQHLPTEVGKNKNVVWAQKTPKGNSSPIVAGDRVWITGYEGDDRVLMCFDAATGAPVWRRAVKKGFSDS